MCAITKGVTRACHREAARETFFSRILDADMDLESVQATDGEIQTDKKGRKNMGSARGRVRQSDTTRDTMARSDEKVTLKFSESCPGQNTGEDLQPLPA